jgi:hypothetical protein
MGKEGPLSLGPDARGTIELPSLGWTSLLASVATSMHKYSSASTLHFPKLYKLTAPRCTLGNNSAEKSRGEVRLF